MFSDLPKKTRINFETSSHHGYLFFLLRFLFCGEAKYLGPIFLSGLIRDRLNQFQDLTGLLLTVRS